MGRALCLKYLKKIHWAGFINGDIPSFYRRQSSPPPPHPSKKILIFPIIRMLNISFILILLIYAFHADPYRYFYSNFYTLYILFRSKIKIQLGLRCFHDCISRLAFYNELYTTYDIDSVVSVFSSS